jgi:hypothetical protein
MVLPASDRIPVGGLRRRVQVLNYCFVTGISNADVFSMVRASRSAW